MNKAITRPSRQDGLHCRASTSQVSCQMMLLTVWSINEQTLSARLRVGAWGGREEHGTGAGISSAAFSAIQHDAAAPVAWLERTRQASSTDDGMGLVNGAEEELLEQVEGQEMEKKCNFLPG